MGMPLMSHPMMGYPTMGSGYGMAAGMGAPAAASSSTAQTPVVHVYTKRRRLIEEGFYDGVAIRKCAVMDRAEICGTFYFGPRLVALEYTVPNAKALAVRRVDPEEGGDMWFDDEIEDGEADGDDEYAVGDEEGDEMEGDEYDDLLVDHEHYALWREQMLLGMEDDAERGYEATLESDYINTVSWIWGEHGCDEHVLSFMNASVCTMESERDDGHRGIAILVEFESENEDKDEVEEMRMNVGEQSDWDEVYHVRSPEGQLDNVKMCRIDREIKLCVEMLAADIVNQGMEAMQISVEFV